MTMETTISAAEAEVMRLTRIATAEAIKAEAWARLQLKLVQTADVGMALALIALGFWLRGVL